MPHSGELLVPLKAYSNCIGSSLHYIEIFASCPLKAQQILLLEDAALSSGRHLLLAHRLEDPAKSCS